MQYNFPLEKRDKGIFFYISEVQYMEEIFMGFKIIKGTIVHRYFS